MPTIMDAASEKTVRLDMTDPFLRLMTKLSHKESSATRLCKNDRGSYFVALRLLELLQVRRREHRPIDRQRQLVELAGELERHLCHSIHFRTNWIRSSSPRPCASACLRQPPRLSRRNSTFCSRLKPMSPETAVAP